MICRSSPFQHNYRFLASKCFLYPLQVSCKCMLLLSSPFIWDVSFFLIVVCIVVLSMQILLFPCLPLLQSYPIGPNQSKYSAISNLLDLLDLHGLLDIIPVRLLAVFLSILSNFDSCFDVVSVSTSFPSTQTCQSQSIPPPFIKHWQ